MRTDHHPSRASFPVGSVFGPTAIGLTRAARAEREPVLPVVHETGLPAPMMMGGFDLHIQIAEADRIRGLIAAMHVLAENYVGLPLEAV